MTLGDSKTSWNQWQAPLLALLHQRSGERWTVYNAGVAGTAVIDANAAIATTLAALPDTNDPHVEVLVNYGSNDVKNMPAQATWEAAYLSMLDAIHAKWPQAQIRLSISWRDTYEAQSDTLAGWVANVIAARPAFVSLADDERVWMENGDDGATYTLDGAHYNAAGATLKAQLALAAMGY